MLRVSALLTLLFSAALAARSLPSLADDTTCSVEESEWFHAEAPREMKQVLHWVQAWNGERDLNVIDAFGFSQNVLRVWKKAGFNGLAFDIKISTDHDITSRKGFYTLLDMAMRLREGSLLFAGPPCSMYVGASSSVHRRKPWRVEGDTSNAKVRLANHIWSNFAQVVKILIQTERGVYFCFEQPAQSYAFKQSSILAVKALASMFITVTWLAFWGTDLLKPTHLLSNMRTVTDMKRKMTKDCRRMFKARLRRRNKHRKVPKVYYESKKKADGTVSWQGCKDLASSAAYTKCFCEAVLSLWLKQMVMDGSVP